MDCPGVSLEALLRARETRAAIQKHLLSRCGTTLVCLTVNMPGPVKRCALSDALFSIGLAEVRRALKGRITLCRVRRPDSGCEAFLCVDLPPQEAKRRLCALEDSHPLGRLWDADVLPPQGRALSRRDLGLTPRRCLLCENDAAVCARSQAHPLPQLIAAMEDMLARWRAGRIGYMARRALEDEVLATPKPGLVDALSSGAHTDMDVHTFLRSARALEPHFTHFAALGLSPDGPPQPERLFDSLRAPGLAAEADMYRATGGVNTHKGAVFSLGLLCAAAGRLVRDGRTPAPDALFETAAAMTRGLCARELPGAQDTHGARVFSRFGARGVRGEAEDGFPSVRCEALPLYRACLRAGLGCEEAMLRTLIRLMACVQDTNVLFRRGRAQCAWMRRHARRLDRAFSLRGVRRLDREMTRRGLSPGGCADLLAVTVFVCRLSSNIL